MNKKQQTLHDLAVRLCEKAVVFYDGQFVRAKVINSRGNACNVCKMDSACTEKLRHLCLECDLYDRKQHILVITRE